MATAPKLLLLPEPKAELKNEDPVETKLSEVGSVISKNLIQYNLISIQLERLQAWISKQEYEWNSSR